MAIYNSGGNDYNWGMDWTPVSQTFLGIGDLLNKKKRLAYEMGDYQGGNPQYAGSLKDTIQKVTSAAGDNPYSAVGTQSGIGGDTLFARGEQAGLNAALAYDKKNPQKISGVDLFLAEGGGGINKMGNVSTDQFIEQAQNRALARQAAADTAKQKMDSSWSVDVNGGKAQLGGEYFGQAYMNPETGKKEWVRPLAETLKSAEQEMAGAPQKKAQQIQGRVADEIRTNVRNGYKYKGADFRQSQEILLNDTLARLAQTNNPREYLNTAMKYIQDVKVANVGMHPDHQIKTNELRDYLLAGMPRPSGGGPGGKPIKFNADMGGGKNRPMLEVSPEAAAQRLSKETGMSYTEALKRITYASPEDATRKNVQDQKLLENLLAKDPSKLSADEIARLRHNGYDIRKKTGLASFIPFTPDHEYVSPLDQESEKGQVGVKKKKEHGGFELIR